MTPDEHAARAEMLLKGATDKYALFANSGEPRKCARMLSSRSQRWLP